MTPALSLLARRILFCGADDWVHMAEAAALARELFTEARDGELRAAVVEALRELLSGEYVRVGDVTTHGFVAWNCKMEDTLERVEREWRALGRPSLGDVAWSANTARGDAEAALVEAWYSPSLDRRPRPRG